MKTRALKLILFILTLGGLNSLAYCQGSLDSVAQSHIDGNVPAPKDFRIFLIRDLEAYFKESLKKTIRADYELLREGATQTGIAYPKFYAWVKILDGDRPITEGAVRVAAIDKKEFRITDYLSRDDIRRNPSSVARVFPSALVEAIKKKAVL